MKKCKNCDETFTPSGGRERLCPDCQQQREADKEEERTMRKQPR